MRKLPVMCGGEKIGEADAERERLYTRLRVRIPLRGGVWRAWAVGDAGEIRIGTLEPVNGESAISRRFSRQALSAAGELSRVELRPGTPDFPDAARESAESRTEPEARPERSETDAEAWKPSGQGQRLFRSARFQRQTRNVRGALTRTDGGRRRVALIRDDNAPFPLPELFCLASAARIGAKDYWVFSFNCQGWPVL